MILKNLKQKRRKLKNLIPNVLFFAFLHIEDENFF